jgi:hypothetical protein
MLPCIVLLPSVTSSFPNFFVRGTLWLRKITTDPHVLKYGVCE